LRKTKAFSIADVGQFKKLALQWAQQFDEVTWLDSNKHSSKYGSFDGLLAIDGLTAFVTDAKNAFQEFKEYQSVTKDWLFGYLSYDLKNDVERLTSNNGDGLHFPEIYFYQPKKIIRIVEDTAEFIYLNMVDDEIEEDYAAITSIQLTEEKENTNQNIKIKLRIFKDEYFRKVNKMLQYIQRGDIYEANFCQEFYAENTILNPLKVYNKLNAISEAPFATFLKIQDKFVLSASPERYIRKQGNTLISQPIKGTAKRSNIPEEDEKLMHDLSVDEKERAENIMIVDLVRNDLSKSATKGSVQVEELCKVYSFEQVHQMISTITAEIPEEKNIVDVLKETFPMGSMTGAPKVSAMEIIEELESFKRGVYSGAVGYITPEQDFDFNVIIRSILYNHTQKYVSYAVGGAITAKAIPEKEYEECLLKAKAMRQVLESN